MPARGVVLGLAWSVALAASASAADLYLPPPAVVTPIYTPEPAFSWTGGYLGIQGGYDWNTASSSDGYNQYAASFTGGAAGFYGGYNWQTPMNLVFGIDASVSLDWASGSEPAASVTNSAGPDWKGFVRGRLGYAIGRFLPYATAGATVMGFTATTTAPDGSGSATPWGWTVGAGVEVALTDAMVVRLDYAYADYGTFTVTGSGTFSGGVPVKLQSHTLMAGVAIRF